MERSAQHFDELLRNIEHEQAIRNEAEIACIFYYTSWCTIERDLDVRGVYETECVCSYIRKRSTPDSTVIVTFGLSITVPTYRVTVLPDHLKVQAGRDRHIAFDIRIDCVYIDNTYMFLKGYCSMKYRLFFHSQLRLSPVDISHFYVENENDQLIMPPTLRKDKVFFVVPALAAFLHAAVMKRELPISW
jgi:hypothetical protein